MMVAGPVCRCQARALAPTRPPMLLHQLVDRPGSRTAGLAMACKLVEAAQDRWRAVSTPHEPGAMASRWPAGVALWSQQNPSVPAHVDLGLFSSGASQLGERPRSRGQGGQRLMQVTPQALQAAPPGCRVLRPVRAAQPLWRHGPGGRSEPPPRTAGPLRLHADRPFRM